MKIWRKRRKISRLFEPQLSTSLTPKNKPYSHWEFLDNQTKNRLRIVPERGGLITEWLCNGKEILYFDLERFRDKDKSIRGGIPILFPICGNLPDNSFLLGKSKYFMNQHGFARDSSWKIDFLEDENAVKLSFFDNSETQSMYPYAFFISMEIQITINSLKLKILIKNLDKKPMPFSFGLHPYFNVTELRKVNLSGLPSSCMNHNNLLDHKTSNQLKNLHEGIDFLVEPYESVTLFDLVTGQRIELKQDDPMNSTVIWTDPPRKMVCLEPWTSPRGALITGEKILVLKPGSHQILRSHLLCY